MNINKSTLRLFNAIQVGEKKEGQIHPTLWANTIPHGFIVSPVVAGVIDDDLLKDIKEVVGISGEKANNSFHKSWKKIKDASIEQLAVEQIAHYITTYGFEALGVYSEDTVFIPSEKLDLPEITEDIKLTVIKGLTGEDILTKIIGLGSSGIALHEDTLNDIMRIVEGNSYNPDFVEEINNRELSIRLFEFFDIYPKDPVEFLRFVVTKLTGSSLLIKSPDLVHEIKKAKDSSLHRKTLDKLIEHAPDNLASIFYRFKPIFLALKHVSNNKRFFNKLRRDAIKMHRPLKESTLNTITKDVLNKDFDLDAIEKSLKDANVFRKTRLLNGLITRINRGHFDPIVYKIRNGKGYTSTLGKSYSEKHLYALRGIADLVYDSIIEDIQLNVHKEIFFVPPYIEYAMPTSEKQFTGNFPSGTYVVIPEDLIVGVHWVNNDQRVDLDLSGISMKGKIGWDGGYRTDDKLVLFSGDMTDARKPKGATEMLYFSKGVQDAYIIYLNYFNYRHNAEVAAKIIVGGEKAKNFRKNYMIDVNNIVAQSNITIKRSMEVLGIVTKVNGENRFYFNNTSPGNSITSLGDDISDMTRDSFLMSADERPGLLGILEQAGAEIVREKPEEDKGYIDLSPEALDKNTIIDLLTTK